MNMDEPCAHIIFYVLIVISVCSSFTESLGSDVFTVQVNEAASGLRTRTQVQVLDRHDGSYLVRYKLWQGYHSVVISVLYNGQHVAASPYSLSGIQLLYFICNNNKAPACIADTQFDTYLADWQGAHGPLSPSDPLPAKQLVWYKPGILSSRSTVESAISDLPEGQILGGGRTS